MKKSKKNFFFYCLAFIIYGGMITAMGPVIPYFAVQTGQTQTFYSFIFLCRAFGYIVGGILVKQLVSRFKLHSILMGACLIGGLSFMSSTFSLSVINLTVTILIGACCCTIINTICNICTMKTFRNETGFYIQFLHTIFGIGGLTGPFVVTIFESKSYFVLGIILAIISFIYLFLDNPDNQDVNRITFISQPISKKTQIFICLLYLLYIGQEVGFGSWISTFAISKDVTNLKGADLASQIFWVSNTMFRILLIYITFNVSLRLKILLGGMIFGCTINLLAALAGHSWFATFIGSFLNGMFLASMFALFLELPIQFGYQLSKKNIANFMMCASMGEGVLSMPIGYAMGLFGPTTLFFTELGFSILSFFIYSHTLTQLQQQTKDRLLKPPQQQIQLQQKIPKQQIINK